ncbi:D-methionine transport system ATP-binding protein [Anaerosolibacter carboniphilus]|uniref:D-methionine transport system ATP-binding protein n=1 Tax=Anaerosolibacter carboniphilus TaxID=1417629 RepID=A0A841KKG7_9FIRM|nr:ATP-binding cassette domain-containing protein [Anaerosolibacter carboniphilus]MBB6213937.1 D-methionine transport system ATP-binding protein [Anaerosolibacter carboniphilus]
MIQIKQLSKIYSKGKNQVTALEDINLTIEQGTIYGIIGLSGAGKSSLIRCINRIEEPTSGEVWINKVDITHLSPGELRKVRKKIGMIFQNFNLLSSKTVFENIAFPLRLNKTPENVVKEKVMALLELVDLKEKAHVYPSQLSGGQKQRVGIARALVSDPDVLLCDEATSALDPKTTKQILSLLKEINQSLGLTIVIITHEMEVIKEVCTDVTILENGRVVEQGKTIDIFSKPGNEITKHFVDQIQHLPTHLHNGTLLSLSFTQGSAGEPVISKLIKELQVDVNILAGKIEWIQEKPIGKLTVEIDRNTVPLSQIIDYFEKNQVRVEVFNYE